MSVKEDKGIEIFSKYKEDDIWFSLICRSLMIGGLDHFDEKVKEIRSVIERQYKDEHRSEWRNLKKKLLELDERSA